MPANHGTRWRYETGCRCDDCRAAQASYQRRYRQRRANGETRPPVVVAELPQAEMCHVATFGPVEMAVTTELAELTDARPGLAQAALALARLLDDTKASSQKPAAAKVLTQLLDKLRSSSASGRRGSLAVVKSMTTTPAG